MRKVCRKNEKRDAVKIQQKVKKEKGVYGEFKPLVNAL